MARRSARRDPRRADRRPHGAVRRPHRHGVPAGDAADRARRRPRRDDRRPDRSATDRGPAALVAADHEGDDDGPGRAVRRRRTGRGDRRAGGVDGPGAGVGDGAVPVVRADAGDARRAAADAGRRRPHDPGARDGVPRRRRDPHRAGHARAPRRGGALDLRRAARRPGAGRDPPPDRRRGRRARSTTCSTCASCAACRGASCCGASRRSRPAGGPPTGCACPGSATCPTPPSWPSSATSCRRRSRRRPGSRSPAAASTTRSASASWWRRSGSSPTSTSTPSSTATATASPTSGPRTARCSAPPASRRS